MTVLTFDLIFLASRLGDPLLVHFSPKVTTTSNPTQTIEQKETPKPTPTLTSSTTIEPPSKKRKMEPKDFVEEEEELIYATASKSEYNNNNNNNNNGSFEQRMLEIQGFHFTVCDSLLNCGPVSDSIVGESKDAASSSHDSSKDQKETENDSNKRKMLELVTCSGAGKNGSLCVFQESVRYFVCFLFFFFF